VVLVFLLVVSGASVAEIIYVDADATIGGDGMSWATSYKYLYDALDKPPTSGDEIWVAQGTYKPDPTGLAEPRAATFQLISGVAIKGGYGGLGKPAPNKRDTTVYETILSGDLNGDDGPNFANNDENSYHVVTTTWTDVNVVLDGLTITNGNANGSDSETMGGGGMFSLGSMELVNCSFSENSAAGGGGGMFVMHNYSTLTNCNFAGNSAGCGGGLDNSEIGDAILTNCTFIGNSADYWGGGMSNGRGSRSVLINCTFSGNTAPSGGGIGNAHGTAPLLTNCTFGSNEAEDYGGGLYSFHDSHPELTNCIFWGNSAYEGPQIALFFSSSLVASYSDIEGGEWDIYVNDSTVNWDNNDINLDPCFVDAGNGDYHLQWDSPCINAGDPSFVFDANERDIDGEPRVMVGCVDIGADETSEKQADFTRNGKINAEDLGVFVQLWLSSSADIDWYILCDLYEDNGIDFADFAEFANDWLWQAGWYEP